MAGAWKVKMADSRHASVISARPDAGFALIIVIWIAALLALVTVGFVRAAQTHVRGAATITQSSRAELLADSGLTLAVLDLVEAKAKPTRRARFSRDNAVLVCGAGGDDRLAIRLQDASGRINLNLAGQRLLQALFIGLGAPRLAADRLADAIIDFRDADNDRRVAGAELPEYLAAGRAFGPKNAPFDSLEELHQVLGLDAGTIEAMLPHVTLHSRIAGLDARFTTPQLTELLARGSEELPARQSRGLADGRLPAEFFAASTERVYVATVTARLPSGTTYVREAVIEMPALRNKMPAYLAWKRGGRAHDGLAGDSDGNAQLQPCW